MKTTSILCLMLCGIAGAAQPVPEQQVRDEMARFMSESRSRFLLVGTLERPSLRERMRCTNNARWRSKFPGSNELYGWASERSVFSASAAALGSLIISAPAAA